MPSLQQQAEAFIAAFVDLSGESHTALRATNCLQIFTPASLNPPAPMTNTQFANHLSSLRDLLSSFPVYAKEIHVNEEKRQALCWATSHAIFHDHVKDSKEEEWDNFKGEYMFLLDFDGEGKITRVLEFLDSVRTTELKALFGRGREVLKKSGGKGAAEKEGWRI